jgi:hypothetical protein
MKTLKKAAAVLFLAVSFLMTSSLAQAASGTATVNYVGRNASAAFIVLIPTGSTAPVLYVLPAEQANYLAALALTALSAGKTITFDDLNTGVIQTMYVNNS